jgi:hypothetical protein
MSIVNNNIENYLTKIITKREFLIASTHGEGQAEFGFGKPGFRLGTGWGGVECRDWGRPAILPGHPAWRYR